MRRPQVLGVKRSSLAALLCYNFPRLALLMIHPSLFILRTCRPLAMGLRAASLCVLAASLSPASAQTPESPPLESEPATPAVPEATEASPASPSLPAPPAPEQTLEPSVLAATPAADRTRVLAGRVRFENNVAVVEGQEGQPVIVQSGDLEAGGARIQAQTVRVDLDKQTFQAAGQVRLERSRPVARRPYTFNRAAFTDATGEPIRVSPRPQSSASSAPNTPAPMNTKYFTEVLVGNDLSFDGKTRLGSLDGVQIQLASFDVAAARVSIEGQNYSAQEVVLRPGGLSEAEKKIYGTPPLSLRARRVGVSYDAAGQGTLAVENGGIYFKKTRIVPLRTAFVNPFVSLGPSRGVPTFRIVPDLSFNSTDRLLLTGRVSVPVGGFSRQPPPPGSLPGTRGALRAGSTTTVLNFDIGVSARVGFRGGLSLERRGPIGLLALQARRADIITTQLTNRLEVDRTPQFSYDSPLLPLFRIRNGRDVVAFASGSAGRYDERLVGSELPGVRSSRLSGTVGLSTRVDDRDGLYADVFATRSRYGLGSRTYTNTGFEVGYLGRLLPRVRGVLSLRRVQLSGSTPFRFDTVEIPRELRATFDIEATPRYLIPIDLRYDLDQSTLRDKSFGLLRNYKTFAYGVIYQTARRDLRVDLRASF